MKDERPARVDKAPADEPDRADPPVLEPQRDEPADEELGVGVVDRGEDVVTRGEARGLAADPGLPAENDH